VLSTTGMSGKLSFQSGWTDAASGRVHMGARWYDPAAGQFTSRDTAQVNPDPDSAAASPFAYTGDDPLTAIDPTGHLALVDGYNASKAIAGSASNIQRVIASQPKAPPPAAKPKAPAKATAGRKAAPKPAVHKVADAAPKPTATVGAAGHAICDGVGQCGSIQSFAPGGVNFLPSVKSQAQDLKDQFQSKLSSINPAARGAQTALKKAEKASVSALASLAALPGLSTSQRASISGLETAISNVRLPASKPEPTTGFGPDCSGRLLAYGACPSEIAAAGNTHQELTESLIGAGIVLGLALVAPLVGAFGGAAAAGVAVAGASDADPDLLNELADNVVDDAAKTCVGGESFTGATKVMLASGAAIPISHLKPGDKVLATSTMTGKTQAEPVSAVLIHHDTDLYDLTVKTSRGTAVIRTTRNHLFWDPVGDRWVKAAALKYGTRLRTADGGLATAAGGHAPKTTTGWMWDLTVPGNNDHDFYVVVQAGDAAVLVHNASCGVGARGGVYTLRDGAGNVVRTGRSVNLAARAVAHANDPVLGQFEFQVEYRTDVYAEQRGLEQLLYDEYPGAQAANGGYNFIRGISAQNPNGSVYLRAGYDYLARQTGGG
jgi:RHS repeat-associated protein